MKKRTTGKMRKEAALKKGQTQTVFNMVKKRCLLQNLTQLMIEKKLTISTLASNSGLDPLHIENMLSGSVEPSHTFLQSLANVKELSVSYRDLLNWCALDESLKYANDNHHVLNIAN